MTVTARKELQSASRLALLGPVVENRRARAQVLRHPLLHEVADTPPAPARAKARSESIGAVGAMA